MEDVLHLRVAALGGSSSFALFYFTRSPMMKTPLAWGLVQIAMNLFMVARIAAERRPITFTEEEIDVYEEHFMPYGCSARSFKTLWDAGKRRKYKAGDTIQPEGEPLSSLRLVICGRVERSAGGKPIPALTSFPGAREVNPEGDAGAWIGELGLMRLLNGGAPLATRTVAAEENVDLMSTQRLLQTLGFYEGRVDAKLGPKTERALRHFQAAAGLKPDGLVGPKTEATIQRVGESVGDGKNRLESLWRSRACGDAIVVTWEFDDLLRLCEERPELQHELRRALAHSATVKALGLARQHG